MSCINDPTRLKIKEVYPAYISLDSFLESSIYNLKINANAHGGWDMYDSTGLMHLIQDDHDFLAVGAG